MNINAPLKSSVIFECFTIVRILYGKSTQCTFEILNYNIVAFYFANFLTSSNTRCLLCVYFISSTDCVTNLKVSVTFFVPAGLASFIDI